MILLLDFVLTTEVELSFCLVDEMIYIYIYIIVTDQRVGKYIYIYIYIYITITDQRVGKNTRGRAIKLLVSF